MAQPVALRGQTGRINCNCDSAWGKGPGAHGWTTVLRAASHLTGNRRGASGGRQCRACGARSGRGWTSKPGALGLPAVPAALRADEEPLLGNQDAHSSKRVVCDSQLLGCPRAPRVVPTAGGHLCPGARGDSLAQMCQEEVRPSWARPSTRAPICLLTCP